MKFFSKSTRPLFSLLIILSFTACTQHQTATVLSPDALPSATCSEAVSEDLAGISDDALLMILDQSYGAGEYQCWEQLVSMAMDQGMDLSKKHLVTAVKRFNSNAKKEQFKRSTLKYLEKLAESGEYRIEDRRLLEAFSSMAINNALDINDNTLIETKIICQRLDPDLYSKIFEMEN